MKPCDFTLRISIIEVSSIWGTTGNEVSRSKYIGIRKDLGNMTILIFYDSVNKIGGGFE